MGLLVPVRCAICGRCGRLVCDDCLLGLAQPVVHVNVPEFSWCRARFSYEGGVERLVTAVKYRQGIGLIGWLAALMADVLLSDASAPVVCGVTWAPTAASRRRRRGFDQAELLARAVAGRLHVPVRGLLWRRRGAPQTGSDEANRLAGPSFVGRAPPGSWVGRAVLVIDDVVTTGATLRAAGQTLRSVGVVPVGLAVAFTPRRVPRELGVPGSIGTMVTSSG